MTVVITRLVTLQCTTRAGYVTSSQSHDIHRAKRQAIRYDTIEVFNVD